MTCRNLYAFYFLSLLLVVAFAGDAAAQSESDEDSGRSLPTIDLADITEVVARRSGKNFLIYHRVDPEVVVGHRRPRDIDYPTLLTILRNNDLAAVSNGDNISIMPVQMVRQHALPIVHEDDDSIADDEWVTRVIILRNADSRQLVPIMRPLLPQAGHMSAHPGSRSILIADRYANVKRVTSMIRQIDAATPQPSSSSSASPSQ